MKEYILLCRWTQEKLDSILHESSEIKGVGARINFLSVLFLGTDYKESTLIGDAGAPEIFVINLEGVDCFTFLDYVEAMRLSDSFSEFKENLRKVRYRNGKMSFENRNHFFTDWGEFNSDSVNDITEKIGGQKTKSMAKTLNKREDGTFFLPGIPVTQRIIKYIPSRGVESPTGVIDDSIINKLKTGDYIGIYSEKQGLDVSHAGITIKDKNSIYFRHASLKQRKVVDDDLREYISDKPGVVILRPK